MNPVAKMVLALGGFLLLWALVLTVDQARGHESGTGFKYPHICCHDADCAPVTWEGENKNGEAVANTKLHSGISTDPRRYTYKFSSPDGKRHICATPDSAKTDGKEPIYYCIFDGAGM